MLRLMQEKKKRINAFIFGALFACVSLAGVFLTDDRVILGKECVLLALGTILGALVVGEIYLRIELLASRMTKRKNNNVCEKRFSDLNYFFACTVIICLAYLPIFLAYYPGVFAYDVDTQIPQYLEGYSKHHSLIHTLYLHFFYYYVGGNLLSSYTAGIAWASVVQMVLFSAMISYVHTFLRKVNVNVKVRVLVILLSALLPFFSVLSISMTKDVFFAGFTGILFVGLYYWDMDEDHYRKIINQGIYIVSVMGTILFRNNGIYALLFVLLAGIILFVFKRGNYKFLICTVEGIVLATIISSGMTKALSAVNGSQNEMLSVPYQQLAYVYHKEGLTDEEKMEIESYIPDVNKYKTYISDPIKANAQGAYHKKKLLMCYLKLFTKYPVEYVEAFLLNNMGYFYVGDITHAEIYGADLEERSGYLLTDTKKGFGVEHKSYFVKLEDLYEKLFSANQYQKILPLAVLCSPALYFWVIILLVFYAIDLKKQCWTQIAFLVGLILTILAGPCALIRYALPYIVCIPVLSVVVFKNEN